MYTGTHRKCKWVRGERESIVVLPGLNCHILGGELARVSGGVCHD